MTKDQAIEIMVRVRSATQAVEEGLRLALMLDDYPRPDYAIREGLDEALRELRWVRDECQRVINRSAAEPKVDLLPCGHPNTTAGNQYISVCATCGKEWA
jgi:hypothetical protein